MDYLHLTHSKLEIDQIAESVIAEDCGAVSLFVGTTRNDTFECKKVLRLEYEAYEPMALKALKDISIEIRTKWSFVKHIAIYHRLGSVPLKEASVVIAISSPHRADSLAAVAHCIDRLKASVPIWKKEIYEGSEETGVWKENVECEHNEDRKTVQRSIEIEQIDKNLIQINVSSEELEKRIQSFMERKREQVNVSNIQDFIARGAAASGENTSLEETCARVRTLFAKRSDSKGHLKVRRVENEWGPQTLREPTTPKKQEPKRTHLNSIDSNSCVDYVKGHLPPGIEERVLNIEKFLSIVPVEPDIYRRLKTMENRIAELQAVSPEYAHFWPKQMKEEEDYGFNEPSPAKLQCLFSADDIARKIEQMEKLASAF